MDLPAPKVETRKVVLQRLLRRRGRSRKDRANSSKPVMIRTRESKTYYVPSPDQSMMSVAVWMLVLLLMIGVPLIVFIMIANWKVVAADYYGPSPMLFAAAIIVAGLVVFAFLFSLWIMVHSLVRIISSKAANADAQLPL